jgi:hypothetical protein
VDLEVPDGMFTKDRPWENNIVENAKLVLLVGNCWPVASALSDVVRLQDAQYQAVEALSSRLDSLPREVHSCQGRTRMADVTRT